MRKTLPIIVMEKLLREAGAHRVSESAKKVLLKELEKKAKLVIEEAVLFTKHAKRKTVKKEDIILAFEE